MQKCNFCFFVCSYKTEIVVGEIQGSSELYFKTLKADREKGRERVNFINECGRGNAALKQ